MSKFHRVVALVAVASAVLGAAPSIAGGNPVGTVGTVGTAFDLEGHRGTRGLRPENTLAAFGYALQIGVTTLELDTGVTKDGLVVVSHERRLSPLECQDTAPATPGDTAYPYVGKLIKDLTLAQIKTLDCGTRHPADPATDPFVATQESVPGTRMPTLAEVFELAERYGAWDVQFDVETKLDPTITDTVAPDVFAQSVIAVMERYGVTSRSMLQSFDWRTLEVARAIAPELRLVALAQEPTIFPGTPWTAGATVSSSRPFDGEVADLAAGIGAAVLSVRSTDITDALIARAHALGLLIVPWTVDEMWEMAALIDRGVDGLITDYPDRARTIMTAKGIALPPSYQSPFDIEGHRGARAHRPENTLSAFTYALDRKVDTLELDTGVTKDGVLVVSHDRKINPNHCHDTAAVRAGDPQFPYAGQLIRDLTLAQIKTLDCGYIDGSAFPTQIAVPGQRMPTLQEVFDLVRRRGDTHVRFNIETKISPDVDDTVPYTRFTAALVEAIEANGLESRAMIQSFDFRTIRLAKQLDSGIETVALIWQFGGDASFTDHCLEKADECSLEARVGDPTLESTWTGGLDWWTYRDLGLLVKAAGADVVSANWQVHEPAQALRNSTNDYLIEDPAIYHGPSVAVLQERDGLRVVPYTVDDAPTMQRVIDLGVNGIISDDVDLLILVAKRNGLR